MVQCATDQGGHAFWVRPCRQLGLAFTPHGLVQLRLPNVSVILEGTPMAALTVRPAKRSFGEFSTSPTLLD